MTIRLATLDDASSLAALSIEVWIGTYLRQGVSGFFADYVLAEYTPARLEGWMADAGQLLMVAEGEEGITGYTCLSFDSPCAQAPGFTTEISTLYVQPRHHGKRIGQALLSAAQDQCRARGLKNLWLTTNSENTPAIGFYHGQGFETLGTTHFRIGDERYPNDVLALEF